MGAFGGLMLTNKGRNLQTKAQTGVAIHFTRMGIGDGELKGTSILELNTLKNERKSMPISKLKVLAKGQAIVGSVLSNQDITGGFYFREIGIFAEDPEEGEILYCYANAGSTADYIPSGSGGSTDLIEKTIDVITLVGNTANVTATINQSLIYETPEGAQEKANAAEESAKIYIDEKLALHSADYVKHPGVATTTNAGNAYAVTLDPAPTSYVANMGIVVTINADSTAAATLNVNDLGAKLILKANGNLVSNLKANGVYTVRYNPSANGGSGAFILQGEGGEYGDVTAKDVRKGKTFGTEGGVKTGTLDLSNVKPENIKKGVVIDGVKGTLSALPAEYIGQRLWASYNYISYDPHKKGESYPRYYDISLDGKIAFYVTEYGENIFKYDVDERQLTAIGAPTDLAVSCICCNDDGTILYALCLSGTTLQPMYMWEADKGMWKNTGAYSTRSREIACNPIGNELYYVHESSLRKWKKETGEETVLTRDIGSYHGAMYTTWIWWSDDDCIYYLKDVNWDTYLAKVDINNGHIENVSQTLGINGVYSLFVNREMSAQPEYLAIMSEGTNNRIIVIDKNGEMRIIGEEYSNHLASNKRRNKVTFSDVTPQIKVLNLNKGRVDFNINLPYIAHAPIKIFNEAATRFMGPEYIYVYYTYS